ncbi:ribonuclease E inhibitor RraA/Dimethylmenaquinone methyltransferase, partial [Blyttiomyces helicus]
RICGPAHTVAFVPLSDTTSPYPDVHPVDSVAPGAVVVIQAPAVTPNAVWGGLMTARAKYLGAAGCVVEGRIRDVAEHRAAAFPVYSRGLSTLGAGAHVRPSTVGQPITLAGSTAWPVVIRAGDIIVADGDGVVRVPSDHVKEVAALCERGIAVDGKCMEDLKSGRTIVETFAKHRGKPAGGSEI